MERTEDPILSITVKSVTRTTTELERTLQSGNLFLCTRVLYWKEKEGDLCCNEVEMAFDESSCLLEEWRLSQMIGRTTVFPAKLSRSRLWPEIFVSPRSWWIGARRSASTCLLFHSRNWTGDLKRPSVLCLANKMLTRITRIARSCWLEHPARR